MEIKSREEYIYVLNDYSMLSHIKESYCFLQEHEEKSLIECRLALVAYEKIDPEIVKNGMINLEILTKEERSLITYPR